jgi:hypothetical protein
MWLSPPPRRRTAAGFRARQRPRVYDAFMRDATLGARIKHVIGAREALGDVVGVQDRDAGRLREAFGAHHQA